MQIADWLDDLGEFPAPMVAGAVAEWRRTQTHRPTPADIRKLCLEARRQRDATQQAAAQALTRAALQARGFTVATVEEFEAYARQRMESLRAAEQWRRSPEARLCPPNSLKFPAKIAAEIGEALRKSKIWQEATSDGAAGDRGHESQSSGGSDTNTRHAKG